MNHVMKFEGFLNIFNRKTNEEKHQELKDIEHKLEFGNDVYLWSTYVRKLRKFLKNPNNIPIFDIGNSLRIFNIVRNKQKMLPSDYSAYMDILKYSYNR